MTSTKEYLLIANTINKYEGMITGSLKAQYESNKEFLNDLINEIKKNGTKNLIEYYKTYSISTNDINKKSKIEELILLLEDL